MAIMVIFGPYRQDGESFSIILTDVDAELAMGLQTVVEQVRIDGHSDGRIRSPELNGVFWADRKPKIVRDFHRDYTY